MTSETVEKGQTTSSSLENTVGPATTERMYFIRYFIWVYTEMYNL